MQHWNGNRPAIERPLRPMLAALSAELAVIARRHRLDTLGYLLDMARLEAENIARKPGADLTRN